MRTKLAFLWVPFVVSGCIHSYYVPNSHHVPLLTEKKDGRIALNYISSTRDILTQIPGFELQGSYALGNHLGVAANFLNAAKTIDNIYFRTRYFDLGGGYFLTNTAKNLVVECYGGYGWGFAENGFDNFASSGADYTKLYIQPTVGFKSRYFDAAFSWRWASVRHSSLRFSGTLQYPNLAEFDLLSAQPTYTVSEPAITLRAGDSLLKFQLQIGWSSSYEQFSPARLYTTVGVFVTLPVKPREKGS